MKLIFCLILFTCAIHAQEKSQYVDSFNKLYNHYSTAKKAAYLKASEEFLNLNFFQNGKGMLISPGVIDLYDATSSYIKKVAMSKEFGLNFIDKKAIGLFSLEYKNESIGVLGCVACHSGQAAGYFIVGLGNKNIDAQNIGEKTVMVEKVWKLFNANRYLKNPDYEKITDEALQFAETLANPKISNETQGMVATGIIQTWFYRQANRSIPATLKRAAVKVPALWGYELKRKAGQFSDGTGDGTFPGWGIAVELVAGQTPENVLQYLKKIEHAEDALHAFLPPKYPFKINEVVAARGKNLFQNTCQKCHGTYEFNDQGEPIFQEPKWIPHHVIKTDVERVESVTVDFLELVKQSPLNSIIKSKFRGLGYFAPRLNGIWARFPYLHNASVPSVYDLLTPPDLRPKRFSLDNAGSKERFDPINLGLTVDRKNILPKRAKDRSLYDTEKSGHTNVGHEMGLHLSHQEKYDVIEYLKTL